MPAEVFDKCAEQIEACQRAQGRDQPDEGAAPRSRALHTGEERDQQPGRAEVAQGASRLRDLGYPAGVLAFRSRGKHTEREEREQDGDDSHGKRS
jgi:hypothetical protein